MLLVELVSLDCLFLACMGGALNESSGISGRVVDAFHNFDCILPLLMRRGFFFEIFILAHVGGALFILLCCITLVF